MSLNITFPTFSRTFFSGLIAALFLALAPAAFADKDPIYTSVLSDKALKGYDAVSYFTAGKPQKGKKSISHEWNGATWLFTSEENRDLFAGDPERYAPQYGGYCAWAVSQGYTASGDPKVWKIVDDKLYVNYNKKVGKTWSEDPQGFIKLANENWPKVLSE
ncbi:MAG: YHS domain-containing (seleno)protein [Pseudomonadota bacterium]